MVRYDLCSQLHQGGVAKGLVGSLPTGSQVCVQSSWLEASLTADCDRFAEYGEHILLLSRNNQRVLCVISASPLHRISDNPSANAIVAGEASR